MPELAEVEYFRKRWNPGLGRRVRSIQIQSGARVFRETDLRALARLLPGSVLRASEARGKHILFQFSGGLWLGVHLGMSGSLRVETVGSRREKHDHLRLLQHRQVLVFRDPRGFGRVRVSQGKTAPDWWTALPPSLLAPEFTWEVMGAFLKRRRKSPIKAVLLMQERFPGIGNWMADEILWRSGIHPRIPAGELGPRETRTLWRETRFVARGALRIVSESYEEPPDTWLFPHRWQDGGRCPRSGASLVRETVGGRTTCWSPARQRLP